MEIKTKTQIKAYDNIVNCVNYIVGGRENEYSDFPELRESVVTYLTNRPAMIEDVYHYVLNTIYVDGCCTNASPAYIKQIKFLGRKWLIECITEVLMNTMKDSAIEEVKEAWRR